MSLVSFGSSKVSNCKLFITSDSSSADFRFLFWGNRRVLWFYWLDSRWLLPLLWLELDKKKLEFSIDCFLDIDFDLVLVLKLDFIPSFGFCLSCSRILTKISLLRSSLDDCFLLEFWFAWLQTILVDFHLPEHSWCSLVIANLIKVNHLSASILEVNLIT